MKTAIRYVIALGIVGIVGASSHAATVVTASHTLRQARFFTAGVGIGTLGFDDRLAQSFTPETSGIVEQVSFVAVRSPGTTADLRVSITTLLDGEPGSVLGMTQLDVTSFLEDLPGGPDTFNSVAGFRSQGIFLEAQGQYAVTFSMDPMEGYYELYADAPGYAGGALLRSRDANPYEALTHSSDAFFEVTINAVPEPGTNILAAVGTLSLLLGARTRRRWS